MNSRLDGLMIIIGNGVIGRLPENLFSGKDLEHLGSNCMSKLSKLPDVGSDIIGNAPFKT